MAKNNLIDQRRQQNFVGLEEIEAPDQDPTQVFMPAHYPPIILRELQKPREIIATIKSWATDLHFKIIKNNNAVVAHSGETYDLLQTNLKEAAIQFYTFTKNEEKTKSLVLNGLPGNVFSAEDIQADLTAQCSDVLQVKQMTSMKGEKLPLNVYLVTYKWSANLSVLKKTLRYVCGYHVSWGNYRKPRQFRGSQCFRCQNWGHISKYCQLNPRCVKCALNHQKGQCAKTPEEAAKCANCSLEHAASYRGCSEAKKYRIEVTKQKNKKKLYRNPIAIESSVYKKSAGGLSMAAAVKGWSNQPKNRSSTNQFQNTGAKNFNQQNGVQNQRAPTRDFMTEIQRLFGMDLESAMRKINEFWTSYDKLKDESSKMLAMMTFLGSFRNNSSVE